jgi:hypothetical protein
MRRLAMMRDRHDNETTRRSRSITRCMTAVVGVWLAPCFAASAQISVHVPQEAAPADDASALAEKLQNPIADLISVPFQNCNSGGGWFIGTSPITTANWDAGGEKWTLPVGRQFGRLIKIADKLPVNLLVGAYYNALRPTGAGTWELRTQVTFIF